MIATIYVLMAVFGFSAPVLIGVAGACVDPLMAAGLYGLKLHIDPSTGRVISALQLLAEEADDDAAERRLQERR